MIVLITSWPPKHNFSVRAKQGGHSSSSWQMWVAGWPHSCSLEQGNVQSGRGVPHLTGGGMKLLPHRQNNSSKPVEVQW